MPETELLKKFSFMNLKTGNIRCSTIAEKILEEITIKNIPKHNCKKCYGRGYVSIGKKSKLVTPCKCVFKVN